MHEVGETTSEIGGGYDRSLMTYQLHKERKRDVSVIRLLHLHSASVTLKRDYPTIHSQLGTKVVVNISHTYSEAEVLVVV